MVLFLIIGFAQIPTLKMNDRVTYKNIIPNRSPKISANPPITSGTIAPPIIPVHKIPEKAP